MRRIVNPWHSRTRAADLLALIRAPNAVELLPLTRVLRMCKDAALGIAWLHGLDPMIIHRDIVRSFSPW